MYNAAYTPTDWQGLAYHPSPQAEQFLHKQAGYMPPFVKQSAVLTPEEQAALPDRLFGLILAPAEPHKTAERLFPVPDAAHTWLQLDALRCFGGQLPDAARKTAAWHLTQAATRHGLAVPYPVQQWSHGMAGCSNKVALAAEATPPAQGPPDDTDRMYGLVEGDQRRYPLHTPALVKRAMDYLAVHEAALTPPQRYQLATKTAARAREEGVALTEKVAQYTYDGTYSAGVGTAMAARTDYAVDQADGQALDALTAIGQAIDGGAAPWTAAAKLAAWDQDHGYAARRAGPSAYEAVLGGMQPKQAQTLPQLEAAAREGGGVRFSELDDRALASLVLRHETKLSSLLGRSTVRQMMEHPQHTLAAFDEDQQDAVKMILAGQL